MMRCPDVVNTTTVTHDVPIETPFVPQDVSEQMAVSTGASNPRNDVSLFETSLKLYST